MWTSTSFVAAVCLLLMLFHAGDSQHSSTTVSGQTCDDGYYGPNCAQTCGNCSGSAVCDKQTGQCGSCEPGFNFDTDPLCKTTLKPATTTPKPTTTTVHSAAGGLRDDCITVQPAHNESCTGANLVCDLKDQSGHKCKVRLGTTCHNESDNCVSGAACDSSGLCECLRGTKSDTSKAFCGVILNLGHGCANDPDESNPTSNYWCTENAGCNVSNICDCDSSSHFVHSDTDCLPLLKPGNPCRFASSENPCIHGASCDGGVCQCNTYDYFVQINNGCLRQKGHNETNCQNVTSPCVQHATCNTSHICDCDAGFFPQVSTANHIILCEPRKPGDGKSECSNNYECVDNADCVGIELGTTPRHCHCNNSYYLTAEGRCEQKLPWGSQCYASIKDECLEHGFCDAGHCKCRDDAYRKLNNTCAPTLNYNSPCQLMNRDSKQCGNGTQCVFRSKDPHPVCGCDIDHFFHDNGCVPRILVGNPCAYIDATFQALKEKQCVDNAHCDFATYHICVCDGGHYSREGYCPAQVAAGQTCDPWDHSENQCADYNTCVQGRCQ